MSEDMLSINEQLDFHYLLSLMRPLYKIEEYEWLPELFSVIGAESLIILCKYAGGETIKIPRLDELSDALSALQLFYDVNITKIKNVSQVPKKYWNLYKKISEVYDAREGS